MKRNLTLKRAERAVTKAVTDLVHFHIKREIKANRNWNFRTAQSQADEKVKDFVANLLK